MPNLTLTAPTIDLPMPTLPAGVTVRPLTVDDARELGRLYVRSYPPEVIHGMDEDVAMYDTIDTFNGAYGVILPTATMGAIVADRIDAAVMTVVELPWDDTPSGPFVIEVFTDPRVRRRGLARALLLTAMHVVAPEPVSLRVAPDNAAALALYRSLGFVAVD